MKLLALVAVLMPAGVTMMMSTAPAALGGAVAMMRVSETTVNDVAATAPKRTADAPEKSAPSIVTVVPPPSRRGLVLIDPAYEDKRGRCEGFAGYMACGIVLEARVENCV